jgi:aspartate racemase
MKTIGLIGGLTCESSAEYYRIINERVRQKLGGSHSAKSIMLSVDFYEIEQLVKEGKWSGIGDVLIDAAQRLEMAGADLLIICANTPHRFASQIQESIKIPLIHIADKAAEKIVAAGIQKVGLLGTKITMEESFYKDRLKAYNIQTLIPNEPDRITINETIFKELSMGIVNPISKEKFKQIIEELQRQGAQGIVLGCTELWMLVKPEDCSIPVFDTAQIHAEAAVDYVLQN